jgi:hypothetical protein
MLTMDVSLYFRRSWHSSPWISRFGAVESYACYGDPDDLFDIAAAYAFYISEAQQVFADGHKRTGLGACLEFLHLSGVPTEHYVTLNLYDWMMVYDLTAIDSKRAGAGSFEILFLVIFAMDLRMDFPQDPRFCALIPVREMSWSAGSLRRGFRRMDHVPATKLRASKNRADSHLATAFAMADARGVTSLPRRVRTGYAAIDAKNVDDPSVARFIYRVGK